MRIKYFTDTNTALLEFSNKIPVETRELNENIYLDLDESGQIVSITVEHAQQAAMIDEFSYQRLPYVERQQAVAA
jgi:uncharacterized protein YuzE